MPNEIENFKIEKSIARGFYGATYLATSKERLPKKKVLKVIPQSIYTFFKKNFDSECQEHAKLNNEYIVAIDDYFDFEVDFNGTIIPCHVSVIDYVEGKSLENEMKSDISIERLTQIIIDLLEILEVLKNNNINHNDLHPGNIIVSYLQQGTRRIDQIDNNIKLIVIDLNSASDKTQSSEDRLGDINWIGKTIQNLTVQFIKCKENKNEKLTDKENRVLVHFENYSKLLEQKVENTRVPYYSDLIHDIKTAYFHVADPWNESFQLKGFDYAYNAQTLPLHAAPALFVDPEGRFFQEAIKPGPTIIYGMRGCGKTLLLLGLTFYARISKYNNLGGKGMSNDSIVQRVKNDGFIGLYINANKLLDSVGKKNNPGIYKPLERMYLRFTQEALRTLMTLKKIKDSCVSDLFYEKFADEINRNVTINGLDTIKSYRELDDLLTKTINALENGKGEDLMISGVAQRLFDNLSITITSCSEILRSHNILFLLDDLSTRYLSIANITPLISTFIFQSDKCAFKITTEEQTLNAILMSPGNIEKLRPDRDFQAYNLGNQVNEEIRKSNEFVVKILKQRSQYHSDAYHSDAIDPKQLLGDCPLQEIAKTIIQTGRRKREKKQFYHGITMLSKVCVGDIGDIIHIYNLMLEKYREKRNIPLSNEVQNDVYQSVSANKLFDIDRNRNDLKDFAITFAKASYKLLMESKNTNPLRLRQYNSINVNITSGDKDFQIDKLRSLVDAGIFIYDGSPKSPRTTGNNTNPLLQFKLAFRKLLGLTNFIGITQADRFELSGEELENWLNNPQNGESILLKNKILEDDDTLEPETIQLDTFYKIGQAGTQGRLCFEPEVNNINDTLDFLVDQNTILLDVAKLSDKSIESCKQYLLGVGFEERTYESLQRVLSVTNLNSIYAIKHSLEEGKFSDITKRLNNFGRSIYFINENDFYKINFGVKTIIDVSGLSKAMIFNSIIGTKDNLSKTIILETEAKELSPSDKELDEIINSHGNQQATTILEKVTKKIESSETEPYTISRIYNTDTDESNYRVILCFSSAKFERMLHFLDNKQYDKILIINPVGNDNRSKLARYSSQVIQDKYSSLNTEIKNVDIINPNDILKAMTELYQKYYFQEGYNFDIALTGSKLQTVCAGIFTCYNKINNCWYISPQGWKSSSFSSGAGDSYLYSISSKQ
jgi:serine/threonine protein kinase